MLPRFAAAICLLGASTSVAAPRGCVGGFAVTTVRLTVALPVGSAPGAAANYLALRRLNNVPSGARIRYQPKQLPADLGKDPRIALVMVPKTSDAQFTVLEPRSVIASTDWQAPFDARIVLVVFAPQGLDEKRLANLITRDRNLVTALADYADQTADLEAGLDAVSDLDDDADDDLQKPARANTPAEQALYALVRSLNPAISAYNPLGTGRRMGSATLMGKGAETFFENAGGFVPGGGILPEAKTFLMPDTEFRSVYAIPDEGDAMTLCAQVQPRTRNKMAYVWAFRLTTASAPVAAINKSGDVPLGMRVGLPLKLDKAADWRLLQRVYDWTLVPETSGPPLKINARPVEDERALTADLRKFPGGPGVYRIQGQWDWGTYRVNGTVHLHRLEDLTTAQLTPESQDRLLAGVGPVSLELTGADFLFVDKAWLHRPGSSRQIAIDLPSERTAPAERLRLDVDTDGLRPGPFLMALSRVDGTVIELPVRLLPPAPRIASGVRVNLGEREQTVTFTGSALDRLESLEVPGASVALQPASEDGARREAQVRLRAEAKAGDRLAATAKVEGMTQALRLPALLQVAAARPRIREARASAPPDLGIQTREGEIPAGSWISYVLRVDPAETQPSIALACAELDRTVQREQLHAGEKHANAQLASAGTGAWFLSLDPGFVGQAGCTLQAVAETEALGASDPVALGKIVRLPRIESFALTDERSGDGFAGTIKGFDLETIEKTGWNARGGVAVSELPRPIPGEGARQTLRIAMPWPSPTPKAQLYVWLRGESEPRSTKVAQ